MSEVRIAAEPRTEFGKGAARRVRRADKVPAVLYGHGTPPRHVSLPGHELMLALKSPNVLLLLEGLEGGAELALPKAVQRDPIKGFLEHVDLLLVRRGEQVTVEVPVHILGEVAPGGLVDHQLVTLSLRADAGNIPQSVEVTVAGLEIGSAVHAREVALPAGAELVTDPDAAVLHVMAARTAEQVQADLGEVASEGAEAEGAPAPEAASS